MWALRDFGLDWLGKEACVCGLTCIQELGACDKQPGSGLFGVNLVAFRQRGQGIRWSHDDTWVTLQCRAACLRLGAKAPSDASSYRICCAEDLKAAASHKRTSCEPVPPRWVVICTLFPSLITQCHACSVSPGTQHSAVTRSPFSTALGISYFPLALPALIFGFHCLSTDGDDRAEEVSLVWTDGSGKNSGREDT